MARVPEPWQLAIRQLDQSNDPRIGSGRDNETGGTLSHLSTGSASLSSLGLTFGPVAVFSAICLIVFLTLRRKCPRVYAPRTIPGLRAYGDLSPPLPTGWFNWIQPFYNIPDTFVLNSCSVDGFFFLRYLRVLSTICVAGGVFTWTVLLPLHGTGGNKLTQLDLLTIGNILNPYRFYAHVLISWCFFGFVLFMIWRECIYYINLRQAYLLSPHQANRLSSRTVLFSCVPRKFLDEARIRKLFGDSVKSVWIPKNTAVLQRLVDEREKTAIRLEKAEIALIKAANAARIKQLNQQNTSSPPLSPASSKPNSHYSLRENPVLQKLQGHHGQSTGCEFHEELNSIESQPRHSILISPTSTVTVPEHKKSKLEEDEVDDEDAEYTHPYGLSPDLADVRGSVAAQYLPVEARPTHRPLANFGRKVDTIRWTRQRLRTLNVQIAKLRRSFRGGDGIPLSAALVEFDSQAAAQAAYQILAHHAPLHMSPRFIGITPQDIEWAALRMRWWERIMRRFAMMGAIAAAVVFWSIPSVFVGMVSNLKFLSGSIPFLGWITQLPDAVTGFIQGLLPAVALSLLMAAVPIGLRACARAAGVPSRPLVELFTQNAYFVFQVIQVFLITTITSAASAAFTQILQNPLSVTSLLSQNLPKASNFYLSYILVQCLAGGSWNMMHFLDIFRFQILSKNIDHPRRLYRDWHRLREVHWGSIFPVYTNMAVIAISYSCIAPLILLFAGLGMLYTYTTYKYNMIYSFDSDLDTKGLLYPRALMHLMVGLYLAEICLIGLFSLQSAFGPVVLMLIFLIFTGLVHISLNDAVSPLLKNLPRTLALADRDLAGDNDPPAVATECPAASGGAAAEYYAEDGGLGEDEAFEDVGDPEATSRGLEGASSFFSYLTSWAKSGSLGTDVKPSGLSRFLAQIKDWTTPDRTKEPNFVTRWFHPEIFEDYRFLGGLLTERPLEELAGDYSRRSYWPPEMWTPAPRLWIPRDEARVSRQEVAHTRESVRISDRGAWLDEKGRVTVDMDMAPFLVQREVY